MKGVELPINVLVIVAIAVIVLLGIIALYFAGFGPFQRDVALEAIKSDACSILIRNCSVSPKEITLSYDADKDGSVDSGIVFDITNPTAPGNKDNLMALCYNYFGATTENACRRICQCPGY